ncbi:class I SAM-dependent methyltransferase [Maridesulfovibrio salexigens]|uniref:Methyltransferase type 11 n=1 Tax=Maridesulfovibrio salexigens (strain ATCC 14822 / DSM 2638 / NCIMB 8403 / VKM B-1763) TaxID=526222 RepID=C6BXT5_MARSD|nr:class I SAM-dependent methyltransferase [Maridesulfovibrio salexigens]ACS78643.1 Methyltransferase type 11 [Maridesulfovibrio salexigens DSM 2638]
MSDRKCWMDHSGIVLHSVDGFDVIHCESCGFKHIIPIPDEEELERIYKHEYHVKDKPLMLQHQLEDQEWHDATNAARLETIEKLLGRKGSILDVGSGNGFFLKQAAELGWQAKGVEPADKAVDYCNSIGLDVTHGVFDQECADSIGKFDAVHLWEVLEHLPDPAGMLSLCRQVLNPGGLIIVGVPNDYNKLQKIVTENMDEEPWWVAPPHHINFFNRSSLENLLRRLNFEPLHHEISFPLELFLLMGKNYKRNPDLGRECHAMRKELELNLTRTGNRDVLDKFYKSLDEAGFGRHTVVMAGKKD